MTTRLVQFRAAGTLETNLQHRTPTGKPVGEIARRDLVRYYNLLRLSLPKFTLNEAMLMVEGLDIHSFAPEDINRLWIHINNAIQVHGLDKKWQVDGKALVEKLHNLTMIEYVAVWDAIELVMCNPTPSIAELKERVKQVGLANQ
jgi:hypothetical protein